MISSMRVVRRFAEVKKMSPMGDPGDSDPTPDKIEEKAENIKEKTKALKKLDKVKKEYQKAQKDVGIDIKAAENPNDDPQELYEQVMPLLRDMGVSGMVDRNRTQLVLGKTKGKKSMYQITLRRNAELTSETIGRIDRQDDSFESMKWTPQAIQLMVWHPYEAPQEDVAEVPEAI